MANRKRISKYSKINQPDLFISENSGSFIKRLKKSTLLKESPGERGRILFY